MSTATENNLKYTKEMPVKPRIDNKIIDIIEKKEKLQKFNK